MAYSINQKSPQFNTECFHNGVKKKVQLSDFDDYHKVLFLIVFWLSSSGAHTARLSNFNLTHPLGQEDLGKCTKI